MHRAKRMYLSLLLALPLAAGCEGDALAPAEPQIAGPMFLAVPKPEARGVGILDSRVSSATVATAAALFEQPALWGVSLTGAEVRGDGSVIDIPEGLVMLDTVDPATVDFLSASEAEFTVPWTSHALETGSRVRVCVQVVHFPGGGERHMGEPHCITTAPL